MESSALAGQIFFSIKSPGLLTKVNLGNWERTDLSQCLNPQTIYLSLLELSSIHIISFLYIYFWN